jgi:uncharacterized protein YcfJ
MKKPSRPTVGIVAGLLTLLLLPVAAPDPASAQTNSAAYCDAYAKDVSWRHSRGGALGGAARGAAGGAVFGGIVGGKKGAKRGAAIGSVAGATSRGVQRGTVYNSAYHDCMRGVITHY